MKILVTGATGFVGTSLCRHLSQLGHDVSGLVRHETIPQGFQPQIIENLSDLLPEIFDQYDVVYHLAGISNADASDADALNRINVEGTRSVLNCCIAAGVKRLVFLSSIKAAGEGSVGSKTMPVPAGAYGESKLAAERLIQSCATELECVIVRVPLVFGPGVKGNFARLIRLAGLNLPLPIGKMKARRSYLGMENLLSFMSEALDHPGMVGQNLLVADPKHCTLPEVVSALAEVQGRHARLWNLSEPLLKIPAEVLLPERLYSQLFCDAMVDVSETLKLTGWAPGYTTQQGIAQMFGHSGEA